MRVDETLESETLAAFGDLDIGYAQPAELAFQCGRRVQLAMYKEDLL